MLAKRTIACGLALGQQAAAAPCYPSGLGAATIGHKSGQSLDPAMVTEAPEIVLSDSPKVVCDGNGLGGHPRVFLTMGNDDHVDCPYCDRRFVLKKAAKVASGH